MLDEAGHLGFQGDRLPDRLRAGLAGGIGLDFQQLRPDAVAAGEHDEVRADRQGLGDHRLAVSPGPLPKHGSAGGIVGGDEAQVESDDLRHSGEGAEHRRGVTRGLGSALPQRRSVRDLIGPQRLAVALAAADDHLAVVHQRRSRVAPLRHAARGLLRHPALPEELAGVEGETVQNPGRAEGEDPAVEDRRGRPRAFATEG